LTSNPATVPPVTPWPDQPPGIDPWQLTNADEIRIACSRLLTGDSPNRILLIEAVPESSTSRLTKAIQQGIATTAPEQVGSTSKKALASI